MRRLVAALGIWLLIGGLVGCTDEVMPLDADDSDGGDSGAGTTVGGVKDGGSIDDGSLIVNLFDSAIVPTNTADVAIEAIDIPDGMVATLRVEWLDNATTAPKVSVGVARTAEGLDQVPFALVSPYVDIPLFQGTSYVSTTPWSGVTDIDQDGTPDDNWWADYGLSQLDRADRIKAAKILSPKIQMRLFVTDRRE